MYLDCSWPSLIFTWISSPSFPDHGDCVASRFLFFLLWSLTVWSGSFPDRRGTMKLGYFFFVKPEKVGWLVGWFLCFKGNSSTWLGCVFLQPGVLGDSWKVVPRGVHKTWVLKEPANVYPAQWVWKLLVTWPETRLLRNDQKDVNLSWLLSPFPRLGVNWGIEANNSFIWCSWDYPVL